MPLSQRYVPHIVALLLVALIPVAIHSYVDVQTDECAEPAILVSSSTLLGSPGRRAFMLRRFAASQFKEGLVPGEPPLSFVILRSYDAKRLYYRLAHRLARAEPDRVELDWLEGEPRLPIRRVSFKAEGTSSLGGEGAYLLVYDGAPVENPYWNQLLAAPRHLFAGNRPMTAFWVSASVRRGEAEVVRPRLDAWLRESWNRYRAVCFP